MLKLDAGNVLLKPSHRRQLMSWLKRAIRFGERMGNLAISITLHRVGRLVEVRADVSDGNGVIAFRSRQTDWRDAARQLVRRLTGHLHDRGIHRLTA
ncbi:MAG: hypothetical protein ABSH08_18760 [Tepidisphaeraceae bacterium]|jgi:hypothetical protein